MPSGDRQTLQKHEGHHRPSTFPRTVKTQPDLATSHHPSSSRSVRTPPPSPSAWRSASQPVASVSNTQRGRAMTHGATCRAETSRRRNVPGDEQPQNSHRILFLRCFAQIFGRVISPRHKRPPIVHPVLHKGRQAGSSHMAASGYIGYMTTPKAACLVTSRNRWAPWHKRSITIPPAFWIHWIPDVRAPFGSHQWFASTASYSMTCAMTASKSQCCTGLHTFTLKRSATHVPQCPSAFSRSHQVTPPSCPALHTSSHLQHPAETGQCHTFRYSLTPYRSFSESGSLSPKAARHRHLHGATCQVENTVVMS